MPFRSDLSKNCSAGPRVVSQGGLAFRHVVLSVRALVCSLPSRAQRWTMNVGEIDLEVERGSGQWGPHCRDSPKEGGEGGAVRTAMDTTLPPHCWLPLPDRVLTAKIGFHKASVAEQPWAQGACVRGGALTQAVSLTFPCARSRAGVSTAPVSRVCAEALAAALSLFFGPQVEHDVWTPWTHRSPGTSTRSRAGSGEARASRWAVCCRTHGVGCYEWRLSMGAPDRSYGCFLYLQFPPVRCRGLAQVPA